MHVCLWWGFLPFKLLSLRFLPYSPDFRFNPRQYVNNTDTFIGCQDLFFFFALHLGRTFTLSTAQAFVLFSLRPPSSPMVASRQTLGQCAPDAPTPPRQPPPLPPHPAACHCSLLCSIPTDGIAISAGFSLSQPLSPTLPAVYFVFFFLIPYQVKKQVKRERKTEWK